MTHDFFELSDTMERFSNHRYAFRPVCLHDAWPIWQASRNRQFNEFLWWDQPQSVDEVLHRLDLITRAHRRGELTAMAGVVRDTGEWVSLIRLMPWPAEPSMVETGIWTHHRFWNGRASLDLARMGTEATFRALDCTGIVGRVSPRNDPCQRLLRLMGMTARDVAMYPHESGRLIPMTNCVITREDWQREYRQYRQYSVWAGLTLPAPSHDFELEPDDGPESAVVADPEPRELAFDAAAERPTSPEARRQAPPPGPRPGSTIDGA